jgi:hypothetical protein
LKEKLIKLLINLLYKNKMSEYELIKMISTTNSLPFH